MSEFIVGARGHDFGRRSVEELLSSIGDAGFHCTQLAYTKAVEGVKSYADVTPELVAATNAAVQKSGVSIAVDGTYVELSYADEDKRRAEVAKALSQVPVAKALRASCMGSETTNMAKQPTVSRREAQEALLRSLGEILPVCEEQGVLFAVECVYYHAMNTPEAVKMVLDTIASPNLRVICDLANYVGPENASVDAQRRLWDKLIVAVCGHGPVLVEHADVLGGGVIAVHRPVAHQQAVAVAPVEAVGVPVHGQNRAHAAAHGIQVLPLPVGIIFSAGKFGLKRTQIRHVDIRHIIGHGITPAAKGVLRDLHGEVGAGITGTGGDHRVREMLRKFFLQAEGLGLLRRTSGDLRDLLMCGGLEVVLYLRKGHGSPSQPLHGGNVQKEIIPEHQQRRSQHIHQQKQRCGPAAGGSRRRPFTHGHGGPPPFSPASFRGRSPVSGRKS